VSYVKKVGRYRSGLLEKLVNARNNIWVGATTFKRTAEQQISLF